MSKKVLIILIALCVSIYSHAAITVTSPSSGQTVKAAEDYATTAFQDPMDMNERTDLGWFVWDITSGSKSNLTNVSFSNGIFSASSSSSDPRISVLDTGVTGTCFLGKIGTNYPINANKYKVFAIRMKLNKAHDALFYWSNNTIYTAMSRSGVFSVKSGWAVYIVNIPDLGAYAVTGSKINWSGNIDSLRFDPAATSVDIDIDWIRIVEDNSSLYKTVRWSGNSGTVDIYLDNDKNEGNGTLGVVASGVSGTSYSLYAGALEPGTYYVGVKNSSGGSLSYSPGYYRVNDTPTIQFTNPSIEGGDDFATVEMGNAWDMNATSDLDLTYRVNNLSITTVSSEDLAGTSLGNVGVLKGTSQASGGVGDPVLYTLLWWGDGRGQTYPIDTDKYRILVLKMALPGNWDLNGGSIARVIWKLVGEGDNENVSQDIIVRHKSGSKMVMNTIVADMKSLPLESGAGSPSHSGWTGDVEGFRLDPLEFSAATNFYIEEIKVAAYQRANESFNIQWNYNDADLLSSGQDQLSTVKATSVSLYYDSNNSGYNGTLITSGVSASAGSYNWDTSGMSAGTYYIYGVVSDGTNSNQYYARWPIVIDHSSPSTPTISLSPSSLSFTGNGSKTISVSNSGGGTLNWSASDNASWLSVSPTSGINAGTVTVTANTSGLSTGTYNGTVTIADDNATNSPQTVSVTLTISGGGGGTPTISLSRDELFFGARGGYTTGAQTFLISNTGSGTLNWSASDNKSWLSVSPTSGSGTGEVSVTVDKSGLSNGTYTGKITVTDANASNSPQIINVTLKIYSSSDKPFGTFSTPEHGSTLRSSIPVTGWVLDDIEVTSVKIYNGTNYVGDAVFVEGARPDVEAAYPGYPKNHIAGWGYMLLTNFLPGGGNGSYTFYAKATDKEGNVVSLGSKTVTLDNANAVKPFGAIDTPAQGGSASGSNFINWGWALTPQPNSIPTDGSTIWVMVNGVKLGHPVYNIYRSDIATKFPTYANSDGAVGYYYIDTTAYDNGVHTIQWTAEDGAGNKDGIGSRYFSVKNTGADAALSTSKSNQMKQLYGNGPWANVEALKAAASQMPVDQTNPLWFKVGYDSNAPAQLLNVDENGNRTIEIQELDRVVIYFHSPATEIDQTTPMTKMFQPDVANRNRSQPTLHTTYSCSKLPIGSTLDAVNGIFYWQAGVGFVGDYPLTFIDVNDGGWWKKTISIRILPKKN